MIIATAGHVDHGKSALLEALTGVDPMHLPEEKKRGMTIDIGFTFLPAKNNRRIAFVDVPGHEKFLSNMLVGVGGARHALLVIACDDGVMPQTREHLAILKLLHIDRLIVALTKADRVDAARRAQLQNEVANWLLAQGFVGTPIFITSVTRDEGIDKLREYLIELPDDEEAFAETRRFRLAIDRVFHVHGAGLIVTGAAWSGMVSINDTLWLTGADQTVRVRDIHAQNEKVQKAQAGQRVALNLAARLDKSNITRGDWLLAAKPPEPVFRVLTHVEVASEAGTLRHWHPIQAHHGAQHASGHLSLLREKPLMNGTLLGEIVLDAPFHLVEDDCLILRDGGNQRILAGGRVLSLYSPRRGKRRADFLDWLTQKATACDDIEAFHLSLQRGYLKLSDFAWARQLSKDGIVALLAKTKDILVQNDFVMSADQARAQREHLLYTLAAVHEHSPDHVGLGRARLHRMAYPTIPEALVSAHIDRLLEEKKMINTQGWLHLPQHSVTFSEAETRLWQKIEPLFADAPCWARDLANALSLPEEEVRLFLRKAARLGKVVAVVRDRYYLTSQIVELANIVRRGCNHVGALRDRLGIGRKLAIQILEFFDHSGFSRRQNDRHVLRDAELFKMASSRQGITPTDLPSDASDKSYVD
ncbi:MAG: selenocysteine-specific translation elongation factor [Burkholderiales bacterium]|jgi:selenocysteine-specific elongation factor|nr:selenocysteine-specific translation elongation factor [Burkholderiales bacterium]